MAGFCAVDDFGVAFLFDWDFGVLTFAMLQCGEDAVVDGGYGR